MRKHAFLKDDIVVMVESVEAEKYKEYTETYNTIIDIEDMIPQPEIGWILVGNKLESSVNSFSLDELDAIQQKAQQAFGQKILIPYINKLGARNFKLTRDGVIVNVSTMASQMSLLKLLLETGALKSSRGLCGQMSSIHTNHVDILNEVIAEITNFLTNNGWE